MDAMGRLNIIKLAAIPSSIGWALIALANNVPMLIAGRVLTGIAAGKVLSLIRTIYFLLYLLVFFYSLGYRSCYCLHD